jgi:hypothetical protein
VRNGIRIWSLVGKEGGKNMEIKLQREGMNKNQMPQ